MACVLGIDCGGSKTRAVAEVDGKEVWQGKAGAANLSTPSGQTVLEAISEATKPAPEADAVCGAFAGLVDTNQKDRATEILTELFPGARVAAVPDYHAALIACGESTDICVIAGTGSIVCSFDKQGEICRSGGKGFLLGDEGSGFQYGRDALLHFLDDPADDVSSRLVLAVEDVFGTRKKSEVLSNLYGRPEIARRVAALAKPLAEDAIDGGIYALKSIRVNSAKLAHVVSKHLATFHPRLRRASIACQGGLWRHGIFQDAFSDALAFWCKVDEMEVNFSPREPMYGAAELARRLLVVGN
jgi:N-acetylglucosamine kinase-like BadF-type ATPase